MDPIFIAARLRRFTASTSRSNPFDPMDLAVPVATQSDDQKVHEWDSRNDECVVEISQVFLRFDGATMGMFPTFDNDYRHLITPYPAIFSQPLAPIPVNNPGLLTLDFLNCPTNTPLSGSVSPTKKPVPDKWKLYLAMGFLDFEGCLYYNIFLLTTSCNSLRDRRINTQISAVHLFHKPSNISRWQTHFCMYFYNPLCMHVLTSRLGLSA
jgi:hypothetical protein